MESDRGRLWVCVIVLVCSHATVATQPATGGLVVALAAGQLRGATRPSGGAEFLGIPYAQPPVGDLRWREPAPVQSWSGVHDATAFGAPCAQPILGDWNKHDADTSSEDCLFLNVITPAWPPTDSLPVMFWIHGGGNAGGTASSPLYKDGTLIQHRVILVTVNYRLGIFGFFTHPELTRESPHHASGNYGLMDQIAALRWVHDNIAKFGGDPANITVFGQSAGALDTSLLMTSPLSKDLFHGAIAESGSALMAPLQFLAEAEQSGLKLAASLKTPSGDGAIKYLRGLSTKELVNAGVPPNPDQPPSLGPNIDGWVFSRPPAEIFASGQESEIPLIIGTTTREFGMSASVDEVRKTIQHAAGSFADRALSLYGLANDGQGSSDPMYGSAGDQWNADFAFRCPVTTQAAWHRAAHRPTYQYQFERVIPGHEAEGAMHSGDLPYVFGFFPKTGNIAGNAGEADYRIADLIEIYWTNFAKKGNPNDGAMPMWPEFGSSQSFLQFAEDGRLLTNATGMRKPQCDLYRELLLQHMNQH